MGGESREPISDLAVGERKAKLRVTAIVPSYDHERWIERSLRSILDQTTPVDRIIYFSDGSRDRTLALAKAILGSDPRVEWLDALEENHGLLRRLSEAFARVGEEDLVILCSGDDAWDPRRVEIQLAHFRDPRCEWSVGTTLVCDAELQPTGKRWDPVEAMGRWRDPTDYHGAILARWPVLPILGWAFRGGLYHRVGGIDLRYRFEDFPLALKFARATAPRLTEEVVYLYRVLDASLSRVPTHHMNEDWARATLAEWRYRPVLALKHASRRYARAAGQALASRKWLHALRLFGCSVACWPSPLRPFQALREARKRRARGGKE
jgi:glycosyltransferase involved in cell wall biosynthesis